MLEHILNSFWSFTGTDLFAEHAGQQKFEILIDLLSLLLNARVQAPERLRVSL